MKPQTLETRGFDANVRWQPFIDGTRVGYRVTRLSDGAVSFIYFNPSTEGEGLPDAFVYVGTHNDPAHDAPAVFVTPEFAEKPAQAQGPTMPPELEAEGYRLEYGGGMGEPDCGDERIGRQWWARYLPNGDEEAGEPFESAADAIADARRHEHARAFAERFEADRLQAKPRILLTCGVWAYSTRSHYEHHDERHERAREFCHERNARENRYSRFWR